MAALVALDKSAIQPGDNSEHTRHDLILAYHPLVRTIACRMARRLPPSVDVDELINVGVLGLIDAIDRFDPERGVPFKAYAEIRIQGAMFDSLRNDDWVPRSVRRKFNRIEKTRNDLTLQLGRTPSPSEMAGKMDTTVEQFNTLVKDAHINRLVSLDVSTTQDGQTPLVESLSRDEETAEQNLCLQELKGEVASAVNKLPEKERMAVTLYYMQGLTLREIGKVLGVTESRACQLRGQGIKRLKFRLRKSVG
jgi:RNA polymerase sigma factor for flagellar operon FliA